MKLNRTELAQLFDVGISAIDDRVRKGMPVESRGSRGVAWVFDSGDCIRWEKERAVKVAIGQTDMSDERELKRRKLAAETAISEIEAEKAKGTVAELAAIERQWATTFAEFRARVLQVPSRTAPHGRIRGTPTATTRF